MLRFCVGIIHTHLYNCISSVVVVVVDPPLLRVAAEWSDNPIS